MIQVIRDWLSRTFELEASLEKVLSLIITVVVILFIAYIADFIAKKIVLKAIHKLFLKTKNKWDETIFEKKVFHRLSHIPAAIVVYSFAYAFDDYQNIIQKLVIAFILIIALLAINGLIDASIEIYNSYDFAKNRPIKGFMQVIKIFFYLLMGILLLGNFTSSQTAWALLSTLGGMTAVILLVFSDSILGLVASIQLTSNNILKIGDWIEMPSQNADGVVVDITLNKIKVQNFDKTITSIPAKEFINHSFKNWEGMSKSGGRRIKRALFIDQTSIRFLDAPLLEELQKIDVLKDYLNQKIQELKAYNKKENKSMDESIVNGRKLTNIGTFRAYIKAYLKNHPKIHQDFILLVRQLPPTEKGLPIELYAFTNDTAWVNYEEIQADIFDHLFAVIGEFDLRVYQSPSSNDLSLLNMNRRDC